MDCEQFYGLPIISWTISRIACNMDYLKLHGLRLPKFHGLPPILWTASISWTVYNFMDCLQFHDLLQFHGLPTLSWIAYNIMDCQQFHGLPAISWTAYNFPHLRPVVPPAIPPTKKSALFIRTRKILLDRPGPKTNLFFEA